MTQSATLPCTLSVSLSRRKSNFPCSTRWSFPVTTTAILFIHPFLPSYTKFVRTQDRWEMLIEVLESPLLCSSVTILNIFIHGLLLSQQIANLHGSQERV